MSLRLGVEIDIGPIMAVVTMAESLGRGNALLFFLTALGCRSLLVLCMSVIVIKLAFLPVPWAS